MFQDTLLSKRLVLSVKTKSTMRIHDGFTGAFAFAEQLCGLENLRVFIDPDSGTAIAMIHYTPAFSDGYMTFPLNNVFELIRVKEESDKVIRVKGLRIRMVSKK